MPQDKIEDKKKVQNIALSYYSMKDVQKAILVFSKNREIIPEYLEVFGKRPDVIEYESDVLQLVKNGATSLHCSEELWQNPLSLSTELNTEELNDLRVGWDLLIDIDSKYLDYSKVAAKLILQALEFNGLKNYGLKFSGNKGFHILIPWKAFPEKLYEHETKNMFPEWARIIVLYLKEQIEKPLINEISKFSLESKYVKDFSAVKEVIPDLILVSSRHLFRMPYSLHEKTALSSVVLEKSEIGAFNPRDAEAFKVKIRSFMPESRENEAKELLIQALDWYRHIIP